MVRFNSKKKTYLPIALALAVMLTAGLLLTGCENWIKDKLGYDIASPEEEEPVQEEPEPAPAPVEPAAPELSVWEQRFSSWPMAFGFAGPDGIRLILTMYGYEPEENPETNTEEEATGEEATEDETPEEEGLNFTTVNGVNPDVFTMAIGSYGSINAITLDNWQNETSQNNHLDNANNFRNLPGFIYSTTDKLLAKNESYLLTAACPLVDSMVAMSSSGRKGYGSKMDDETIESIQTIKNRAVERGSILAVTKQDGARIGLVQYERSGNDMMFSLVYMDESRTMFWDCPAAYNESSTWWTDGKDDPGMFVPLLLASFDEGLVLAVIWTGPKEEVVLFLIEEDGAFVRSEDLHYERAWL